MKRLIIAVVAFGALALALVPGPVSAAQLSVALASDAGVTVGQPGTFIATVTDAGQPVAGVSVEFYVTAAFGKTSGDAEIGRAVTDSAGVASITYEPRTAGARAFRVQATATDGSIAKAAATIDVADAPAQLYTQTAGIKIPGVNVWLIMALLTVIWGTLFGVGITLLRIAQAGDADAGAGKGEAA
jgi:hypothetical protein